MKTIKSEVTREMVDDLNSQLGYDVVQRMEHLIILLSIRKHRIEKILSKIDGN